MGCQTRAKATMLEEVDQIYVQALENEARYYRRYFHIISVVFMVYAMITSGLWGVWWWTVLTLVVMFASV